jgi:hypothetical protein
MLPPFLFFELISLLEAERFPLESSPSRKDSSSSSFLGSFFLKNKNKFLFSQKKKFFSLNKFNSLYEILESLFIELFRLIYLIDNIFSLINFLKKNIHFFFFFTLFLFLFIFFFFLIFPTLLISLFFF